MELDSGDLRDLHAGPQTGVGFYVLSAATRYFAALEDRSALPLQNDPTFYDVSDLLNGDPLPTSRLRTKLAHVRGFGDRNAAIAALSAGSISPRYLGSAGAVPLIATYSLSKNATFRRYYFGSSDPRYVRGQLVAGTYVTSPLDAAHADSGFGAVGRYALPIPLPAIHVVDYQLAAGTLIKVGTVTPNFGQAGGGVEICLTAATPVLKASVLALLPEY